jgi:hypothetical protein
VEGCSLREGCDEDAVINFLSLKAFAENACQGIKREIKLCVCLRMRCMFILLEYSETCEKIDILVSLIQMCPQSMCNLH